MVTHRPSERAGGRRRPSSPLRSPPRPAHSCRSFACRPSIPSVDETSGRAGPAGDILTDSAFHRLLRSAGLCTRRWRRCVLLTTQQQQLQQQQQPGDCEGRGEEEGITSGATAAAQRRHDQQATIAACRMDSLWPPSSDRCSATVRRRSTAASSAAARCPCRLGRRASN